MQEEQVESSCNGSCKRQRLAWTPVVAEESEIGQMWVNMKAKPSQQDLLKDWMWIIKKKKKKMSRVSQKFLTPNAQRVELPFMISHVISA